ncbi:MAG: hypothetical protein ACI9TH_003090 [Kiritimatiellia bacterium]|jgi:4-hydroxybenzoate polyprenyltransferase
MAHNWSWMEIRVLSISFKIIAAYLRERMLTWRMALLLALLVACSYLLDRAGPTIQVAFRLEIIFFLVLQFRLQDDLNDRESDRINHPDRVMVRCDGAAPFLFLILFCIVMILLLLRLLHYDPMQVNRAYLLGSLMITGWYGLSRLAGLPEWGRSIGVIAKYPIIVSLVSARGFDHDLHVYGVLLGVYLLMLVYELAHDPSQRPAWMRKQGDA